ncbi:YrdB family protein [Kitasatospora sp. GAS204B]|uniref:YrdB family protein n=1 Tax=unclassified Kitasatospora TaxID=2633591 RepID=UPI002474D2E6|nr:YrdB family protein [Kitasatospora sp. GAS204B]MDH6121615.1 membrane protein YdbS with pleckstrin-like domain [Kitasatospora sp. GAS204B]
MLTAAKAINLTLAFLLELAVLFSVGLWGFTFSSKSAVKFLLGIGGPLLFIVVWAVFGSPSAAVPLHGAVRIAFEVVWFGLGALALYAAGRVVPAAVLFVLYVINAVLIRVWHQSA